MTTQIVNRRAAREAGYWALTSRYRLPEEQWMLDGVLADMRRGNIGHVLVMDRLGVSVWRTGPLATVGSGTTRTDTRGQEDHG